MYVSKAISVELKLMNTEKCLFIHWRIKLMQINKNTHCPLCLFKDCLNMKTKKVVNNECGFENNDRRCTWVRGKTTHGTSPWRIKLEDSRFEMGQWN